MSSNTFHRLLYTDCRPGEGLGGGGGYQVQAQTEGCSPNQGRMAIGWLLYSIQPRWMVERRAVEDFPGGLAHSADSGYGTGQSRYLGTEANGNRQGNYLTDCVLTDRAASYGVIRPAQLWQAPFWREVPWPSTTAPEMGEEFDLGPLDFDRVAEWLQANPKRVVGLERLLTVLEDADGPRVVIRSPGPEEALTWIAAATMLLPMVEALSITFRVFANKVDDAPHRIVAVPEDLHPQLGPGSRPKTLIIDAATDETDEVEPSDRARFWVRQLLEAPEPFDVVEAVELAVRLGGTTEEERSDDRHAAMTVIDPDHVIEDAAGVGRWLRRAMGSEHEAKAHTVVARLVAAADVRLEDLRLLDDLAADRMVDIIPSDLRSRLFDAELALAVTGVGPPASRLAPVSHSRTHIVDAEHAIVSAMVGGSNAVVDAGLRLAWRHGMTLEPTTEDLGRRLSAFVTDWIGAPNTTYSVDSWALRDPIVDELAYQLRQVWKPGDRAGLGRILGETTPILVARDQHLTDSFSLEIEAYYQSRLKPCDRPKRVRSVVHALEHQRSPRLFEEFQAALVGWRAADPESCMELVALIPTKYELNYSVLEFALRGITSQAEKGVDEKLVGAVEQLHDRGLLPDRPRLQRIAASVVALEALLKRLDGDPRSIDPRSIGVELGGLLEADDGVVELSMPNLVAAAFQSPTGALGQSILRFLQPSPALSFATAWQAHLSHPRRGTQAAADAFVWCSDEAIPMPARRELSRQLVEKYQELSRNDADIWHYSVGINLQEAEAQIALKQLLEGNPGSKRRGRFLGRETKS